MKRLIVLEVEVQTDEELRMAARCAVYGAWGVLGPASKPVVKIAGTAAATVGMRAAWEALP